MEVLSPRVPTGPMHPPVPLWLANNRKNSKCS